MYKTQFVKHICSLLYYVEILLIEPYLPVDNNVGNNGYNV